MEELASPDVVALIGASQERSRDPYVPILKPAQKEKESLLSRTGLNKYG